MTSVYSIIPVPLDAVNPKDSTGFKLRLITKLEFGSAQAYSAGDLRAILEAHPLLRSDDETVDVYIAEYSEWRANGNAINTATAQHVPLEYTGPIDRARLLANLLSYFGSGEGKSAETPRPDPYFDSLDSTHFVNVPETLDACKALLKTMQRHAIMTARAVDGSLNEDLASFSVPLSRWINGAAQTLLLYMVGLGANIGAVANTYNTDTFKIDPQVLLTLQAGVSKVAARIDATLESALYPTNRTLQSYAGESLKDVDLNDLNVAIHAAAANSLLARSIGLVTEWNVEPRSELKPDVDYVVLLNRDSMTSPPPSVDIDVGLPTVFRRSTHTHPTAFYDLAGETRNCGLAYLNDGEMIPRYLASSVNTEHEIAKLAIVQSRNSLNGAAVDAPRPVEYPPQFDGDLDDRPPEVLAQEQYGIPEPETSGVIFSAPIEDVVKPEPLVFDPPESRASAYPCYFLEDLRIGYRLDLRSTSGAESELKSVHAQDQKIRMKASDFLIDGSTEDYFFAEQPSDPKYQHSTTEIAHYRGMNTAQVHDYLRALGQEPPLSETPGQPFTVVPTKYRDATRLLFGQEYEYRLRHVFVGAVSLSESEANQGSFAASHFQRFPFYRAKAFRPGELVSFDAATTEDKKDHGQRTIFLTRDRKYQHVFLAPTPLSIDDARFHGLVFSSKDEPGRHANRQFVSDLGKFFVKQDGRDSNYFLDPEVSGVIVRAKILNGDPQAAPDDYVYSNGRYCKVVKHLALKTVTQAYGQEGKWESFRPIRLIFSVTNRKRAKVSQRGLIDGAYTIEYDVPEGNTLQLSILPDVQETRLSRTSWKVGSSWELSEAAEDDGSNTPTGLPEIAEQVVTVIHCVSNPLVKPTVIPLPSRTRAPSTEAASGEEVVTRAHRDLDSEFADVIGRVELDAASSSEIYLEGEWEDINDGVRQPTYILDVGKSASKPRSVVFEGYSVERPSFARLYELFLANNALNALKRARLEGSQLNFLDGFSLQCSEDKVFLRTVPEPADLGKVAGTSNEEVNRINFRDQRRKLATIRAVAVARHRIQFPDLEAKAFEARSDPIVVDAPSSLGLSHPKISYVMPIIRDSQQEVGKEGRRYWRLYGIRVYVNRPWFESGAGERLAVGCATQEVGEVDKSTVSKFFTQWGEDPLERPRLDTTLRVPRAADFGTREDNQGVHQVKLDERLYPPSVIGGTAPVTYQDNIWVPDENGTSGSGRYLSCASYALRFDPKQQLWYADIVMNADFFGWCGLALYRFQPHAVPGRELSAVAEWVYAAVIYDEPIAWIERSDFMHLTIGPVYDPNVSFEVDSVEYCDGVSENVSVRNGGPSIELKGYVVDGAGYFEGAVPKRHFHWNLVKKRFGVSMAARSLFR